MGKAQCFLGIDVGTEGTKVALFDVRGRVVGYSYEDYGLICLRPGWAEQDPETWWQAAVRNIRAVLGSSKVAPEDIEGIGVCGQMHAPVPIGRNGELLYRSPSLWCDKRNAPQCKRLRAELDENMALKTTGNPITPPWTGLKILWMKENMPRIYEKTDKFLVPKDYLVYMLTHTASIDWSEASGTFLYDVEKEDWSDEMAQQLEIDLDKLPEIYASHVVGEVTSEAADVTGLRAGTPVVSGGGDFLCTLLGAGVTSPGKAADISGTASLVAFCSEKPLIDRRIMNLHHVVRGWVPFGLVEGGLLRWFRDEFGYVERQKAEIRGISPYRIMDDEAESVPPGAGGLVLLPYFIGGRTLGSPYARGVLFGLTLAHQRGHVIRALMEGITFALRQTVEMTEELGLKTESFRLIGGGAVSPLWRQIEAGIYGKPGLVLSTYQGGILGAAVLAMVGTRAVRDASSAIDEIVSVADVCKPAGKNREEYNRLYSMYERLHDSMQAFYDRLEEIQV